MFRRRSTSPQPAWRDRFDRSRRLLEAQAPPGWMLARLTALERALVAAEQDHERLEGSLAQLDVDQATAELKAAMRNADASPEHRRLVATLRQRYETIHELTSRAASMRATIDRTIADVDLLAARAIGMTSRDWELDETVARLSDDLTALERAHRELDEL